MRILPQKTFGDGYYTATISGLLLGIGYLLAYSSEYYFFKFINIPDSILFRYFDVLNSNMVVNIFLSLMELFVFWGYNYFVDKIIYKKLFKLNATNRKLLYLIKFAAFFIAYCLAASVISAGYAVAAIPAVNHDLYNTYYGYIFTFTLIVINFMLYMLVTRLLLKKSIAVFKRVLGVFALIFVLQCSTAAQVIVRLSVPVYFQTIEAEDGQKVAISAVSDYFIYAGFNLDTRGYIDIDVSNVGFINKGDAILHTTHQKYAVKNTVDYFYKYIKPPQ